MSSIYPSFGGAAARQCARCGAPLAPNESQCSRCGAFNSPPQVAGQPGMPQQGPGAGPWGSQLPQTPPFPQSNGGAVTGWGSQSNLFNGQGQQSLLPPQGSPGLFPPPFSAGQNQPGLSNPNQSMSNNSFGGFPQNSNQSSFNNSFGSFPQNPNQSLPNNSFGGFPQNSNQSLPNNSFGSFPQNSNQSGLNSSNSFFNAAPPNYGTLRSGTPNGSVQRNWQAYQSAQQNHNDDNDDDSDGKPTTTHPLVIVLIVVLLVTLIGGGGFGVWHFVLGHGGTTNSSVTPVAIVTPSVTPLFSDTFQNNNNGWDTSQPTGAQITVAGGKLVLESDNNELFQELLPNGKTYSDLRVDVDVNLTKGVQGNGYGIYIRGSLDTNGSLVTYYRFEVYGNGTFAIYKGVVSASGASTSAVLKTDTASPAIYFAGQTNHLTVIAKGTQMTFEVNGTTLTTVSDDTYKGGQVALFVSNVQNVAKGAQATFTKLAIFPVS